MSMNDLSIAGLKGDEVQLQPNPPSRRKLQSWKGRAETIRRSAGALMCEMMECEPEGAEPMQLSDWADNITNEADDLIEAIEAGLKE